MMAYSIIINNVWIKISFMKLFDKAKIKKNTLLSVARPTLEHFMPFYKKNVLNTKKYT